MHLKKIPRYYCIYCGDTFDLHVSLFNHVKFSHFKSTSNIGTCYICGKDSLNLVIHVFVNHDPKHCIVCGSDDKLCQCYLSYTRSFLYWRNFLSDKFMKEQEERRKSDIIDR